RHGFSVGPLHLNVGGGLGKIHHRYCTVLAPISTASMNLTYRTFLFASHQAQFGAYSSRITPVSSQANPHSRLGPPVVVKFCHVAVLRHHHIHSAVSIVIAQRAAALLAIYFDAAFLAWHGSQFAMTITAQQQTS